VQPLYALDQELKFESSCLGSLYEDSNKCDVIYKTSHNRCAPAFYINLLLLLATVTISAYLLASPRIDEPTAGSMLSSPAQKFSWSINDDAGNTDDAGDAKVERVWLYVGTSLGTRDIANSGDLGLNTEFDVIGMPQDGSTVHARLWFFNSDRWGFIDSSYSAANNDVEIATPAMNSPTNNSEFTGASVKFEWSDSNTPVNFWWLYLGMNQGGND